MIKHTVKIQRSLASSDGQERVLVYNEDRTILQEFDMTDELRELFLPHDLKLYFEATLRDGVLSLGDNLPEQDF
ncbi:hypothetical protein [Caudoviricetes sp.]|nr:hypothetical protein [Caudoviricetes sp.]